MEAIKDQVQQSLGTKITPDPYSHIVLTQDEIDEALRVARKFKDAAIRRAEYSDKLFKDKVYPKYNSAQLLNIIKARCVNYNGWAFKDTNPDIINSLLQYFTDGTMEGFNPDKGIMLLGGVGCGKTTLMKLFGENQKASYIVVSCRKVAKEFANGGPDGKGGFNAIEKYWNQLLVSKNFFGHDKLGICFDDLGTESDKKNFGNELNVMAEVILNCYDNSSLKGMVHITTNLDADEIEKFYGTRVRSRLREMTNPFTFNKAVDLRK